MQAAQPRRPRIKPLSVMRVNLPQCFLFKAGNGWFVAKNRSGESPSTERIDLLARQTCARQPTSEASNTNVGDMTEPRFAVCTVGDDRFSVKDRKTSQPLGYYRTQAEAERARDAFNRLYQEEEEVITVRRTAPRRPG